MPLCAVGRFAETDDSNAFTLGLLGWMLENLDVGPRSQDLSALRATIDANTTTDGVVYESGTWLIRAWRAQDLIAKRSQLGCAYPTRKNVCQLIY